MPRDDEDRVFDVSKPHKVSPSATSKPIIVGHHPVMNDPMVTESQPSEPHGTEQLSEPTRVSVSVEDNNEPSSIPLLQHSDDMAPLGTPPPNGSKDLSFVPTGSAEEPQSLEVPVRGEPVAIYPQHEVSQVDSTTTEPVHEPAQPAQSTIPGTPTVSGLQPDSAAPLSDLPLPTHHNGQAPKGRGKKWLWILVILIVLAGVYALLDAKTSVSLPFYLLRKTTPVQTPLSAPVTTAPSTSTPATSDSYAGWKSFTLAAEKLTFKYPSGWTLADNTNAKANLDSNGVSYGDNITLTGTDNFSLAVQAGQLPPSDTSGFNIDQSDSVTFASQPAKLNLLEFGGQNTGTISEIVMVNNDGNLFTAKNVPVVAGRQSNAKYVQILANYGTSNSGSFTTETLTFIQNDTNYKDMKLIIKSMSY